MKMVAKGFSHDDFPENGVGPTIIRRRSPCIFLEGSQTHSPRRVVLYFYRHFGSIFSKTTSFVLKMMFSHT